MTTHTELQLQLEQFDEIFIEHCKKAGLSQEKTRRELLESPSRKLIVDAISESFALDSKVTFIPVRITPIETLKAYNHWRRSNDEKCGCELPNPAVIGVAIDAVIK